MGEHGEEAEDEAEAVEERWRAAERVGWGEAHPVAYEAGVVDEVASSCQLRLEEGVVGGRGTNWCVSIAALGLPVVPLVNCRLQTW